jgi:hypothetical protein
LVSALGKVQTADYHTANPGAMLITFPAIYGIDYSIKGNPVRQIALDKCQREGILAPFIRRGFEGFVFQPGVVDKEMLIVTPEHKTLTR